MNRLPNVTLLAVLGLSPGFANTGQSAADPPAEPSLTRLRTQYKQAREKADAVPRPDLADPDFSRKVAVWSTLQEKQTEKGRELARELVKSWKVAEDGSKELTALQEELADLHRAMAGPPFSVERHEQCVFFAEQVRPVLLKPDIGKERAAFLTTLTVPHQHIRDSDRQIKQRKPSEPFGWEIQDTYSLALARAGQIKQAREENDLLQAKVNLLLQMARLPRLIPEQRREGRGFLVHRALIESLGGDGEAARKSLADVAAMSDLGNLSAPESAVVAEVRKRLEPPAK